VKHVVGDLKLNLRQLNLLVGIKGFNMIEDRTAATAN
jgi:hypothetical protein